MLITEREKKICAKYSAHDKDGFVHCYECPLNIDEYYPICKATHTYNRHTREWEMDE